MTFDPVIGVAIGVSSLILIIVVLMVCLPRCQRIH